MVWERMARDGGWGTERFFLTPVSTLTPPFGLGAALVALEAAVRIAPSTPPSLMTRPCEIKQSQVGACGCKQLYRMARLDLNVVPDVRHNGFASQPIPNAPLRCFLHCLQFIFLMQDGGCVGYQAK